MSQRQMLRTMLLAGVAYACVGIVFAWPTTHVRLWRLGAWVVSAAIYAAHILHERLWLRTAPLHAACHVALAAALGAFGLAVGAIAHSRSVGASDAHMRLLLIALAAWPIITGVPAFLVAFVLNVALMRLPRFADGRDRMR